MSTALLLPLEYQRKAQPCKVQAVINALPEPYKTSLTNLVVDDTLSTQYIKRRILAANLAIGDSVLYRHRTGTCCCTKGDMK